jgi:cupin fold WbuC family metalloprotein
MTFSDRPERFTVESPEVFYAPPGLLGAGPDTIDWLIEQAGRQPSGKSRLCLHASPTAPVHDMIVVHGYETYVRPHRHLARGETLTLLRGRATAVVFDETGAINDIAHMHPIDAGGLGFYRMPPGLFHALVVETDWVVFHETCAGPFDRTKSEAAPWSPEASDRTAALSFLQKLRAALKSRAAGRTWSIHD